MSECTVNVVAAQRVGQFTGISCGEPATVLVEHGCVHEHIGTETVCAGHAGKIGDREMACTECWRAGHYCPVVIRAAESPP